ncbi:ankyrin repeat domain-containing protein [Cytophagales bacterium LB-30]|uniref:Ankyrin repeat domain-containing protein n=1 Tax=Shiella aurantiaca TaxID=3058365 RepID=A0ABT8F0M0_9BACT|nr:ankyrin repeat domain-containing protein [Shiella aurantiaca]MDN4163987.1 ankyrin repeat domain-containing protein [Shiella aurantiaca]
MTLNDLFQAAREGNLVFIQKGIAQHPEWLHTKDDRGFPLLVLAAYYNQLGVVEWLIENGADPNATDKMGNTALMGTCFKGFTKLAELLIEKGTHINHRNAEGATALIYAATFGQTAIAQLLLAKGADASLTDHAGNTALQQARIQANQTLMDILST